jgi:hypothetical protein
MSWIHEIYPVGYCKSRGPKFGESGAGREQPAEKLKPKNSSRKTQAEELKFRIRASLQRCRKCARLLKESCFVSGHRFSDAASHCMEMPL